MSALLSQGKNIEPRQGDCSKNITAAMPGTESDFEKELEKVISKELSLRVRPLRM